ncbi:MAG: response regulator, partial [Pseudomonadota bacterium]
MQGTILILDGVATNRIMLKVQLTAAWYHVVQGNGVDGILPLVRRTRPDLILCAMSLPDGDAIDVREALQSDDGLADIPIIAVTPENDRAARLRALAAGLDDVLSHPYNDVVLLARIRSLIRAHAKSEELKVQDGSQSFGFGEVAAGFDAQPASALIAVVTRSPGTGSLWRSRLSNTGSHSFTLHKFDDLHKLVTASAPDAFVIELSSDQSSLRLLADLRARSFTRNAVIIGVPHPGNGGIAAEALDRGADDVMPAGFDERELVLRLDTQLRRKARTDRMRTQLRDGMRAALLDP